MARAAFQLAMSSDKITSDVFEAQEFPELAQRYQVRGVPMTLVNEGAPITGNVGGGPFGPSMRKRTGVVPVGDTSIMQRRYAIHVCQRLPNSSAAAAMPSSSSCGIGSPGSTPSPKRSQRDAPT